MRRTAAVVCAFLLILSALAVLTAGPLTSTARAPRASARVLAALDVAL